MRSLEQQRAEDALARVQELPQGEAFRKRYRAYVDRLGPAILTTGLGQALAAERAAAGERPRADDERAHQALFANLGRWLCRPDGGIFPRADDILVSLVQGDEALYLAAQAEALSWLQWHKKFCRAYLPREDKP